MKFFDPTANAMAALAQKVAEVPAIQARLVERHPALRHADRVAHQQQIAGGPVTLAIAATLPAEIDGIGPFVASAVHGGIGRISNGLGCPHLETDPDFLGIMLAFRVGERRVDFLGINDRTAPTDTIEEFVALLAATAESAGVEIPFGRLGELDIGNLTAGQLKLFAALEDRLGLKRATQIYAHVAKQTAATLISSTAYQPYWTGIARLGPGFGKFTLVPIEHQNRHRSVRPGARHLSDDWRRRNNAGALRFGLYWIPYVDEKTTPTERLTRPWDEAGRVEVASVTFPQTDAGSRRAKLFALLASEMGANPGHWIADRAPDASDAGVPATEFMAGRFLAYRASQQGRSALPEPSYSAVFETGEIETDLAAELVARHRANRAAGHPGPEIDDLD